jgi:molybdopterin molybdotransferase
VRSAFAEQPVHLAVTADVPAGQTTALGLEAGQAVRIMTGAPLPQGADAVVPVEDTDFPWRQPGLASPQTVQVFRAVQAGDNVRPAGQDMRRGELALEPGQPLRPQEVGFLAMLGAVQVPVHRRPRVAILSTGDELLAAGAPLAPGKIYDSNTPTLIAQVQRYGGIAIDLGIAEDREDDVRRCLDQAVAQGADLVLSSAGVSVGAFDFVRSVVEQDGRLEFWRVNMRPGKPFTCGMYREIPFIGLPGNPVSAFVGFEVFVRPALQLMSGAEPRPPRVIRAALSEAVESDGRESYLRGVITCQAGSCTARLTGHQGSGNLRSLVQANALLLVPSGVKSLPSGAEIDAWLFED